MKRNFTSRLSKKMIDSVRKEAARHGTTNDIVLATALEDFFTRWDSDRRRKFYQTQTPYARKAA